MRAKNVVLIVEDDDGTREMMQLALAQLLGVEVVTVESGEQAIRQAHILIPEVIVFDILLAGASGLEVVRLLKASRVTRSIPIVGIAASHKLAGAALEAGCVECLLKPFPHVQQLVAAVQKYRYFQRRVANN